MTNPEFAVLMFDHGLRQSDVAWICGVNVRQVRAWVIGETAVPQYAALLLQAYVENLISPEWLCLKIDVEPPK